MASFPAGLSRNLGTIACNLHIVTALLSWAFLDARASIRTGGGAREAKFTRAPSGEIRPRNQDRVDASCHIFGICRHIERLVWRLRRCRRCRQRLAISMGMNWAHGAGFRQSCLRHRKSWLTWMLEAVNQVLDFVALVVSGTIRLDLLRKVRGRIAQ